MNPTFITAAALFLSASATAQSRIVGLDLSNNEAFRTFTSDFVSEYTPLGANSDPIRALDFDASATTLWGIRNDTREYGTLNPATGTFSALGVLPGTEGLTGLTAAVDGQTWYLSTYDSVAGESNLYKGDVTAGSFSLVGVITSETVIDLAIDSRGHLFAITVSDDSLYSVDKSTGAGTWIGPLGVDINFAQGMDFDWSTDRLFATLNGSVAGSNQFARIVLATGNALLLEDTSVLGAEMEMAVRVAAFEADAYCFGDGSGTPCPCGNAGSAGAGCANGSFASGARLSADGRWYAVALQIEHGAANQPVLFFEGENQLNGGDGIPFGDGLRCAGSNVKRLSTQAFDASGFVELTGSVQDNGGGAPGELRTYQGWFRDPLTSPCGSGFNLTNGLAIQYPPLP